MKEDVLPEGWEIKRFEGVIDIQGGSQPPKSEFIYEEQENYIRLLQIRDFGEKPVPTFVPKNRVSKFCQETDILIARYGASLGRIVTGLSGAYNVALAKTIYDKSVLNDRFVFYLLQTPIFQKPLSMISRSAQNGFAKQDIADIKIPLPPLPEQQYLSQKLTALLDEVAQTKQRLEAIPALLKQFRQSVLADAVSGRLTEEWREENGAILSEGKISNFVTFSPKKDKLEDDLVVSFSSMHLMSENVSEHLTFEQKHWKDVKKGFTFFKNNDVLLAKITPCFENGKSAVAQNLINGIGAGSTEFMVFRCNESILPKYLYFNLNTDSFRQNGTLNMSGSVGHKRVPKEFVLNWNIVLPSITEQTQIVQKVETYFALADEIETQVKAALENVNLLTQSILAKAFSGELSAAWRNSKVTETQGNV